MRLNPVKNLSPALFLFLLWCLAPAAGGQDTLLLFHPTVYNLEVIQNLMDKALLNLEGYHVKGVYHELETYDYSQSEAYIGYNRASHFSLEEIHGNLGPDNIFGKNGCTGQFTKLMKSSRGALFMGGPDIPPEVYNEETHLLTMVTDPYRNYCELSFLFHLLGGSQDEHWIPYLEQQQEYLVSGICLGMQTMNVATGGTLVQDIPTELYGIWTIEKILSLPADQIHKNYRDTSYHFHHIRLTKGSFLNAGYGLKTSAEPLVLSSHHQAVEHPGKGWLIAATSMDGKIVEAIRHERYPHVFGVQFHPEHPDLFNPPVTGSYAFHLAYWKNVGSILQSERVQK